MNTNDQQQPATPASALLFQAPQFQAPQFQESATKSAEDTGNETRTQSGKGQRAASSKKSGSGKQTQGVDESSAASASEGKSSDTQKKKGKGVKSGKAGKSSKKGSGEDAKGAAKAQNKTQNKASNGEAVKAEDEVSKTSESTSGEETGKRRRRRSGRQSGTQASSAGAASDEVTALKGSTRLEAKRMRRREGRREGRQRQSITEAEFLARRESVNRKMVVRHKDGLDQIAVLEDDLLVEHYVARKTQQSIVGNIYLGRVQNVLPSMEAAFVDIGKGRNAVLYAGEVNWDALGMEGKPRRIEQALKSGDTVLVQATKDPIGHKGARLTSQITLAGRFLVLVPGSGMLGISRKLPDTERQRLKKILKDAVPDGVGVIVRTAAEGATEQQLRDDIDRLVAQHESITKKQANTKKAPQLLRKEPELVVRVVRDIFNEDFDKLIVQGADTWDTVSEYVEDLSPDLSARLEKWLSPDDVFHAMRIDQQLAKGMDRKVWLPSGGTLVIDRTEALTVVDVNTGKFIGSGGTLEETVTRNNLEAAEEIVRQLRLRDIGGIIIIDFVDMVLESNRDLVLRRLIECLGRDRTRHQVTEITSLGLVQMTRKRVGEGLVEAFSTTCEACEGRGFIVHDHPVEVEVTPGVGRRAKRSKEREAPAKSPVGDAKVKSALTAIAAASGTTADSPAEEETPREEIRSEDPSSGAPTRTTGAVTVKATGSSAAGAKAEGTPKLELKIELPERKEPAAPKRKTRRRVATLAASEPAPSSQSEQ